MADDPHSHFEGELPSNLVQVLEAAPPIVPPDCSIQTVLNLLTQGAQLGQASATVAKGSGLVLVQEGDSHFGVVTAQALLAASRQEAQPEQVPVVTLVTQRVAARTPIALAEPDQIFSQFQTGADCIPVVNAQAQVIGIITPASWLRGYRQWVILAGSQEKKCADGERCQDCTEEEARSRTEENDPPRILKSAETEQPSPKVEKLHNAQSGDLGLQAKARQQAIVADLGQKALSGLALPKLIYELVIQVGLGLQVEYCKVLEMSQPEQVYLTLAAWDVVNQCYVVLDHEPVSRSAVNVMDQLPQPALHQTDITTGLSVSIYGQRGTYGILEVYSDRVSGFSSNDLDFLQSAANVLAAAIDRQRGELAIREQENSFRALLEQSNDAIFVHDRFGKILDANGRACQLLGSTPERLAQFNLSELQYQSCQNQWQVGLEKTCEMGEALFEAQVCREDGTLVDLEVSAKVIDSDRGLIQSVVRDISDRRQVQERLRLYGQAIAVSTSGISISDARQPDFPLVFVNPAFEKITGYPAQEVLGQNCRLLQGSDRSQPEIAAMHEAVRAGTSCKVVLRNYRKDGSLFWNEVNLVPIYNDQGVLTHILGIQNDITEFKQAEERLRQVNDQLLMANAELAQATQLKDDFLANMSHELRTPLNAILGMSEGLMDEVFGELNDRQRRCVTTIEKSGRHLLDLINDILDLAKIEAGKLELHPSPVSARLVCDSSLTFVRHMATSKNIQLSVHIQDEIREIHVDERRIRQVLINLLTNAVKFTPEGGKVTLTVFTDQPEVDNESLWGQFAERSSASELHPDACVAFSVCDTGIGIAPENMGKLFQSFVQIDSSLSRQYAGTGLGLALVRRLVELHGGSISVESQLGKGSCFTVRIAQNLPDASQISAVPGAIGYRKALIIGDVDHEIDFLIRELSELGISTITCDLDTAILRQFDHARPDLVILDLALAGSVTWELLRHLQTRTATRPLQILVVINPDQRVLAPKLGASACLVRPLSQEQLRSVLERLWQASKLALSEGDDLEPSFWDMPLVLLAEDNEANATALLSYLSYQGYRVLLARNGVEAVDLTRSHQPDLVLMDIQMPGIDGLEAIRQIRSDRRFEQPPIVALTALMIPGDREKCLAAGADEYLTKPVRFQHLTQVLRRLLQGTDNPTQPSTAQPNQTSS